MIPSPQGSFFGMPSQDDLLKSGMFDSQTNDFNKTPIMSRESTGIDTNRFLNPTMTADMTSWDPQLHKHNSSSSSTSMLGFGNIGSFSGLSNLDLPKEPSQVYEEQSASEDYVNLTQDKTLDNPYMMKVRDESKLYPATFMLGVDLYNEKTHYDMQTAQVSVSEMEKLLAVQNNTLDMMRTRQIEVMGRMDASEIAQVKEETYAFIANIESQFGAMYDLVRNNTLEAKVLIELRELIHKLKLQESLAKLLYAEICNPSDYGSTLPCQLYISKQPLPQVLFKSKSIEDEYVVSLISTRDEIQTATAVLASLESDETVIKGDQTLENNTSQMDLFQRKASFGEMKVGISSRMNIAFLKFHMDIGYRGHTVPLASERSFPFIAITNESQWCEAAGKLLLMDAFSDDIVPWSFFANTVHSHFLKATKQEANNIVRPLYHMELQYFHSRFFGFETEISMSRAKLFWDWFGQCLQTIRFKRHIGALWNSGLIFGFLTKEECNQALENQGLGTFLLRFSESNPGLFGIAYVSDDHDEKIKHCLVRAEEIGSNKSLAEFLRDKEQFQYILSMSPEEHRVKVTRLEKNIALGNYYAKKKTAPKQGKGYIVL